MKPLSELLKNIPNLPIDSLTSDPEISAIAGSIQHCKPECLFVADVSETVDLDHVFEFKDGADFLPQAIEAGARVIITRPNIKLSEAHKNSDVIFLHHPRPLQILGEIASRFYSHKSPSFAGAVTGTNGKTSTVNFAAQIFEILEHRAIGMGNMGIRKGGLEEIKALPYVLSTPETVDLHRIVHEFHDEKYKAFFTEASSHALHDYRLCGLKLNAAAFTNMTQDHLDFHGTMDAYFQTKATLFTDVLQSDGVAILNADMDYFEDIKTICQKHHRKIIEYGRNASDIKLLSTSVFPEGLRIKFRWNGQEYDTEVPVAGSFQAYNILCAIAFADVAELPANEVVAALSHLKSVEARMEHIKHPRGNIYLDFAHTPDALEQSLKTAQALKKNRVLCLFSCNGGDKTKRPKMMAVAEKYSDVIFLTDGTSRPNYPQRIRNDILEGYSGSGSAIIHEIEGRSIAIETAIMSIETGDILFIAGAGSVAWPDIAGDGQDTTDSAVISRALKIETE